LLGDFGEERLLSFAAIEHCRMIAESMQRPDQTELDAKRQQVQRLTGKVKVILKSHCEPDQDEAENQAVLTDLRRRRAKMQAEVQRMEEAASKPITIRSVAEVESLLENFAKILTEAAFSFDEAKVPAARRIIVALSGGRIVISQQGDPRLLLRMLRAVADSVEQARTALAVSVFRDAAGATTVIGKMPLGLMPRALVDDPKVRQVDLGQRLSRENWRL
jgi:hypothetical protein